MISMRGWLHELKCDGLFDSPSLPSMHALVYAGQ